MGSKKVGMIGIGKMGKPMSLLLIKAGFNVTVFDVVTANMEESVKAGAIQADSVGEVARKADVIVLSLPNIPVTEHVVADIIAEDIEGKVILDTTTATMEVSKKMNKLVSHQGGTFLDAPITGGVAGAEKGILRFFVGGDSKAFEEQQDVFTAMGQATLIGEIGHGQVGKMICQMIGSAKILMAIEAAGFAMHIGVDVDKINETLANNGKGPMDNVLNCLKTGEFNNEGYLTQRSKDIDYCLEEASKSHTFLPITAAMQQMFNIARMKGLGDMDNEAIIKLYEEWIEAN